MTSNNHSTKIEKSQDVKKKQNKKRKVAIVHDFLLYPGGAERVLSDICRLYPEAPIYTLLYDEGKMRHYFSGRKIITSFLQRWPKFIKNHHKWLLPFYGTAVESFDLREFDVVISSSGAWSKGIITRLDTKHIAYIHSPMRYVWDENEHYLRKRIGKKNNFCVRTLLSYLRVWDNQAAQRPDVLVANSAHTQKRIKKYYRRDSVVVYPGVEVKINSKGTQKKAEGFLIISRLSEYKNVALAIEACNKLQLQLTVIGEGREYEKLQKMAGPTVKMVGWVSEEEKIKYLQNSRALLFPSEDDFGITGVEAIGVGIPVTALNKGGVVEIIQAGVNGEVFDEPTVEMLADALRRFIEKEKTYDKNIIKGTSKKFSKDVFDDKLNIIFDKVVTDE